jgi:hypothetical protein
MSIATVICRAQLGLHAPRVQVEVSLDSGLPGFSNLLTTEPYGMEHPSVQIRLKNHDSLWLARPLDAGLFLAQAPARAALPRTASALDLLFADHVIDLIDELLVLAKRCGLLGLFFTRRRLRSLRRMPSPLCHE